MKHSSVPINIEIAGKNLIITGGNGCGKTTFIEQLYSGLMRLLDVSKSPEVLNRELASHLENVKRGVTYPHYSYCKEKAEELKNELEEAEQVKINMLNQLHFNQNYADRKLVLSFYEANRQSEIVVNDSKPSLHSLIVSESHKTLNEHFGVLFEKYLVAKKAMYNDIIASNDNAAMNDALNIESWFNKVEEDLRYLFEDDQLKLIYNREKQSYYIHQINKKPFNFDELSSGFSSIMYIYTDLLMKVELKSIPADELEGIVLIDEIDAHLHVSLQRRILFFFTNAFPNIQFIVTTHSPFVVQSIDNAIIYDLSSNEVLEDLSTFSYQSILEGLLGVTVNSLSVEELLDDLDDAMNLGLFNPEKVSNLIRRLDNNKENLSEEAHLFIQKAKIKLKNSKYSILDNSKNLFSTGE